ncbi:DUF1178 family protein [Parapusillimonas granuli]|uniref:DUF1178 family protein n=1 Tax=Parapusillimonas granuli TaxID=380911 RepID=A0A853FUN3_9BURK|nr:DUF1178 family protein [Parapusillimonas granuli]MBB5213610.1 hypothetical protein [Parapusillimonas granuli]MEB2398703.1 DUF1178 family protein [Alcaligenaceae bacterium]NYT48448.1 DUF1178 family protein [Parapusillimonas granuli]
MSLKVFDLQCERDHVFEGWFSSAESYDSQRAGGLLSCPVCNSTAISKKLSAPRLNVSHIRAADTAPTAAPAQPGAAPVAAPALARMAKLQAEILRQMREMIRNTENVGVRFAEEARRMHEGEADERPIRGTATPAEREALANEGIAVMPIPEFLDDDRLQ